MMPSACSAYGIDSEESKPIINIEM